MPSPSLLNAAIATGSPSLTVIDVSSGGLLVQASEPLPIGAVVQLHLSLRDGSLDGTFGLRCLHTHRSTLPEQPTTHVSALVFVHPLDDSTREKLERLGDIPPDATPSRGMLRLAVGPRD